MDKLYPGTDKVTGELYSTGETPNEERRPFKAFLDVGLVRTTLGNKVFAAMKGACDGGIFVPHNTKRFPGYTKTEDAENYDAKVHRDRIFGVHVDQYMAKLKEDGAELFKKQFSVWEQTLKKAGVSSVEKLYEKIHASIRKNPVQVRKAAPKNPKRAHVKYVLRKLTHAQRKENIAKKIAIALKRHGQ